MSVMSPRARRLQAQREASLKGHELIDNASIWTAVVAATAYARGLQYQDARVGIEREAGKMLKLAA